MKNLAVFCGSSTGDNEKFTKLAIEIGSFLAKKQINLVFGGGNVGLMGLTADACLKQGGTVTGVIPSFLKEKELAHPGITKLIETESMHERKKIMSELSDAFLIIPGGIGTMDEFFEILTWRQLGLHDKNIGILDVDLFYAPLWEQLNTMVNSGFLPDDTLKKVIKSTDQESIIEKLLS